MRQILLFRVLALVLFMAFVFPVCGQADVKVYVAYAENGIASVLTQHNDMRRTGSNLNEQVLNTSNVNASQFGLVAVRSVDGQVYAQPLYVPNVTVPGKGSHNIVFVVTEHDSVYAFDADDPYASKPFWHDSFINPAAGVTSVSSADVGTEDISPEIGITGTPVIDPSTGTLYVVAETKAIINGNAIVSQRLHALDIATGQERSGSPIVIQGSVNGTGDGNDGAGLVHFDALRENQRAGLLLLNGVVYIAWASQGDNSPFHGWVIGYDAHSLAQVATYNASPNGGLGGIWQGGNGLVADASNIYLMTGNGTSDAQTGGSSYGECFLKLNTLTGLTVSDWFMTYNFDVLNQDDTDLGSAGPMLIPGTNLLVGGGKQGVMYLVNTGNMGHFQAGSDSQVVQRWQAAVSEYHAGPIYWNSPDGPRVYAWGSSDYLKAFAFNGSVFNTTPVAQSTVSATWPGGGMSLSANGSTAGRESSGQGAPKRFARLMPQTSPPNSGTVGWIPFETPLASGAM